MRTAEAEIDEDLAWSLFWGHGAAASHTAGQARGGRHWLAQDVLRPPRVRDDSFVLGEMAGTEALRLRPRWRRWTATPAQRFGNARGGLRAPGRFATLLVAALGVTGFPGGPRGLGTRAAAAVELEVDASAGAGFVHFTSDTRLHFDDARFAAALGLLLLGDWQTARAGLRGAFEFEGRHVDAGLRLGWAPAQGGRGWAEVEPRLAVHGESAGGRVDYEVALGLELREADVAEVLPVREGTRPRVRAIGQLRGVLEASLSIDEAQRIELTAVLTHYDTHLDMAVLQGADFGPLVAYAGRVERLAGALRFERRLGSATARVPVTLGLGLLASWEAMGAEEAALPSASSGPVGSAALTTGVGLAPRVSLRIGPVAGFTIEPLLECAWHLVGAGPLGSRFAAPPAPQVGLSFRYMPAESGPGDARRRGLGTEIE